MRAELLVLRLGVGQVLVVRVWVLLRSQVGVSRKPWRSLPCDIYKLPHVPVSAKILPHVAEESVDNFGAKAFFIGGSSHLFI